MYKCERKNKQTSRLLAGMFFIFSISILSACVQSSSPNVTELIPTERPAIGGQYNVTLTSSSSTFNIAGTCDTKSYGTEYTSNGGATWIDLGPCTTGTFTFNVVIVSTARVEIRSRTKFAFTSSTIANVRVVIPPTANLLSLVTASHSDVSSLTSPTLSFTMSPYMTGKREPPALSTFNMDHLTTGIAYGP